MTAELWLPTSNLTVARAEEFPAGSLVFYRPQRGDRDAPAPAIRFDLRGEDGSIYPWLFWLQGGPWGADPMQRTATICRDIYDSDKRMPGVKPSESVRFDIELGMHTTGSEDGSWSRALGAIASTTSGFKIAAVEFTRSHCPVPINIDTWMHDPAALQGPVDAWYQDWQIRISDGKERTFLVIKHLPPPAK